LFIQVLQPPTCTEDEQRLVPHGFTAELAAQQFRIDKLRADIASLQRLHIKLNSRLDSSLAGMRSEGTSSESRMKDQDRTLFRLSEHLSRLELMINRGLSSEPLPAAARL